MFKRGRKLGDATIVAKQEHRGMYHLVQANNRYRATYDYVADVVPDSGGSPFRATFTATFTGGDGGLDPDVGERVRVRLRGGKDDVELDMEFLRSARKGRADANRDAFGAAASGAFGERAGSSQATPTALPSNEVPAEKVKWDGTNPSFAGTGAAIAGETPAIAGGRETAAARLAARLSAFEALRNGYGVRLAEQPADIRNAVIVSLQAAGVSIDPSSLATRITDPAQVDTLLAVYKSHGLLPPDASLD